VRARGGGVGRVGFRREENDRGSHGTEKKKEDLGFRLSPSCEKRES
jgi:hypothetical protein